MIRKGAQQRLKTGDDHWSLTRIFPLDFKNLPFLSCWSWSQIKTQTLPRSVMVLQQRYPMKMPPLGPHFIFWLDWCPQPMVESPVCLPVTHHVFQTQQFPKRVVQRLSNECPAIVRSEEHTSELQSHLNLVCRLLLEK